MRSAEPYKIKQPASFFDLLPYVVRASDETGEIQDLCEALSMSHAATVRAAIADTLTTDPFLLGDFLPPVNDNPVDVAAHDHAMRIGDHAAVGLLAPKIAATLARRSFILRNLALLGESVGNSAYAVFGSASNRRLIATAIRRHAIKSTPDSAYLLGRITGFLDVRVDDLWTRFAVPDPLNERSWGDFSPFPDLFPRLPEPLSAAYNVLAGIPPQTPAGSSEYDPWDISDAGEVEIEFSRLSGRASSPFYTPSVLNGSNPFGSFVSGFRSASQSAGYASLEQRMAPGVYTMSGGFGDPGAVELAMALGSVEKRTFATAHIPLSDDSVAVFRAHIPGKWANSVTLTVGLAPVAGDRTLTIRGPQSRIKYKSSFFDLSVAVSVEAFSTLFAPVPVRQSNDPTSFDEDLGRDVSQPPTFPVTGTLEGVRVQAHPSTHFELPLERYWEMTGAFREQFERIRPLTRQVRRFLQGLQADDQIGYAPFRSITFPVFQSPNSLTWTPEVGPEGAIFFRQVWADSDGTFTVSGSGFYDGVYTQTGIWKDQPRYEGPNDIVVQWEAESLRWVFLALGTTLLSSGEAAAALAPWQIPLGAWTAIGDAPAPLTGMLVAPHGGMPLSLAAPIVQTDLVDGVAYQWSVNNSGVFVAMPSLLASTGLPVTLTDGRFLHIQGKTLAAVDLSDSLVIGLEDGEESFEAAKESLQDPPSEILLPFMSEHAARDRDAELATSSRPEDDISMEVVLGDPLTTMHGHTAHTPSSEDFVNKIGDRTYNAAGKLVARDVRNRETGASAYHVQPPRRLTLSNAVHILDLHGEVTWRSRLTNTLVRSMWRLGDGGLPSEESVTRRDFPLQPKDGMVEASTGSSPEGSGCTPNTLVPDGVDLTPWYADSARTIGGMRQFLRSEAAGGHVQFVGASNGQVAWPGSWVILTQGPNAGRQKVVASDADGTGFSIFEPGPMAPAGDYDFSDKWFTECVSLQTNAEGDRVEWQIDTRLQPADFRLYRLSYDGQIEGAVQTGTVAANNTSSGVFVATGPLQSLCMAVFCPGECDARMQRPAEGQGSVPEFDDVFHPNSAKLLGANRQSLEMTILTGDDQFFYAHRLGSGGPDVIESGGGEVTRGGRWNTLVPTRVNRDDANLPEILVFDGEEPDLPHAVLATENDELIVTENDEAISVPFP